MRLINIHEQNVYTTIDTDFDLMEFIASNAPDTPEYIVGMLSKYITKDVTLYWYIDPLASELNSIYRIGFNECIHEAKERYYILAQEN